ncbi:MAG TPA: SDR family oxidoreductase [Gemmatimonadaceae bacterium]|nr:SDR family oxidoreductase [Gemmatimonadaceae bacterium]
MQIKDSVAFVTGANRGIGRAFIDALLERGARRVYAAARDLSALDSVVRLDPARVRAVKLDVTSVADARVAAALGDDVTLLINNAAILNIGSLADLPVAAVRDNMETNFYGLLNVTTAFIPVLERHAGAVVNILTLLSMVSAPRLAAYNASKAAGWSLTQSFRADLVKRGIAVHGVFPGAVDTDMARGLEMPKTAAIDVARATLGGVESGDEDIYPDPMSQEVFSAWRKDHKAVERQFATL